MIVIESRCLIVNAMLPGQWFAGHDPATVVDVHPAVAAVLHMPMEKRTETNKAREHDTRCEEHTEGGAEKPHADVGAI
jgi:hypothetical protein